MNKCIYGQNMAKEKILEFVGKWITNPNTTNEPLAFIGEKGTGKTNKKSNRVVLSVIKALDILKPNCF